MYSVGCGMGGGGGRWIWIDGWIQSSTERAFVGSVLIQIAHGAERESCFLSSRPSSSRFVVRACGSPQLTQAEH